MFITVENLKKSYQTDCSKTDVLKGINFNLNKGEICLILGSSGCGKSTLLNCIGGLDYPDSGKIVIDGLEISSLKSKSLLSFRKENIGFVFQNYNLIPNLTVKENIELCKYLTKTPLDIAHLISVLGLNGLEDKFPYMLSGGQQQRVAIARAVIKNPSLLLCDEPTGALDSKSAKDILLLLESINEKYNTTIIIVSHNLAIKPMANTVITLSDGVIKNQTVNNPRLSVNQIEGL